MFQNGLGLCLREICVPKSIGLAYGWKEIYVSNVQRAKAKHRSNDKTMREGARR